MHSPTTCPAEPNEVALGESAITAEKSGLSMNTHFVSLGVMHGEAEFLVPRGFFTYRALDAPEMVESDSGRTLIRFGVMGLSVSMYLDKDSQEVLYGLSPGDVNIVNTSVSHFTQCILRLSDIFPFYDDDCDSDEWEVGAEKVEDVIREVDPSAYHEGSYWYEFRWDVTMGNFHG
ncbi:SUKH-4 family immunity protein [Streptomyces pactum]|uniref:SUKH-4 family immunity protein n=1 Tax=Streptomyces pactum TaxID=68249 RepID=UPI00131B8C87|nr:SUKH-4 family immunity protein [Streptomyces pactum]